MKEKIKITHVARYARPHIGGIETTIEDLNNSLSNEEFDKEVLSCSNIYKSSIDNGVKYTRCRYLFEIFSNTISLSFLWRLSRVKTDILHYHMPFIFAVIAHFIARPKYKKLYITYHSDIVGFDKVMKPFWFIYKKFIARADKIHVLSPNIINSSKMIKPHKNKCVVIPQGVSTEENFIEEEVEKIKNKYNNKKIIFSLGRHVKYKGFIYGIEAMKKVENAIYLIGGDGVLSKSFKSYIEKNNLSDRVVLLGRIDNEELKNYYKACDIYLFPSITQTEAFGTVQVEAMKYSKPIINTNLNTGVNYVSIDNLTGLTVEPKNSDELAIAINKLLDNNELKTTLGKNGRKRVEELFDINKIKEQYKIMYRTI